MRGNLRLIGSPLLYRLSMRKSTVKPAPLLVIAQFAFFPFVLRGKRAFSQSHSSFVLIVFPFDFPAFDFPFTGSGTTDKRGLNSTTFAGCCASARLPCVSGAVACSGTITLRSRRTQSPPLLVGCCWRVGRVGSLLTSLVEAAP